MEKVYVLHCEGYDGMYEEVNDRVIGLASTIENAKALIEKHAKLVYENESSMKMRSGKKKKIAMATFTVISDRMIPG